MTNDNRMPLKFEYFNNLFNFKILDPNAVNVTVMREHKYNFFFIFLTLNSSSCTPYIL